MGLTRHLDKDERNCNSRNEDKVERRRLITLRHTVGPLLCQLLQEL